MEAFWKLGHVHCNSVVRYYCLSQTLALSNLAFSRIIFSFPIERLWSALLLMLISIYISNSDLSFTFWTSLLGCRVGISNTGSRWNHVPLNSYCHVSLSVPGPVSQKCQGSPLTPLFLLPRECSVAQSWWFYLLNTVNLSALSNPIATTAAYAAVCSCLSVVTAS